MAIKNIEQPTRKPGHTELAASGPQALRSLTAPDKDA